MPKTETNRVMLWKEVLDELLPSQKYTSEISSLTCAHTLENKMQLVIHVDGEATLTVQEPGVLHYTSLDEKIASLATLRNKRDDLCAKGYKGYGNQTKNTFEVCYCVQPTNKKEIIQIVRDFAQINMKTDWSAYAALWKQVLPKNKEGWQRHKGKTTHKFYEFTYEKNNIVWTFRIDKGKKNVLARMDVAFRTSSYALEEGIIVFNQHRRRIEEIYGAPLETNQSHIGYSLAKPETPQDIEKLIETFTA